MVKVLKSGFYSTIQDLGRLNFQEYGVPISGVMDTYAALLANALLGNDKHNAVIEMTMTGGVFKFQCNTQICLTGANFTPMINGKSVPQHRVFTVKVNDILSFGKLKNGFRCYLAIYGGFNTERVMNSRSMYNPITQQSSIKNGDVLKINKTLPILQKQYANLKVNSAYLTTTDIDVLKGPEFNLLNSNQQNQLLSFRYTISKHNNRMAYQLIEPLTNNLDEILTSAVLPGTVQLTPSGKLIILMRDCQTTGGYPRVLQLKESSINILAQKFTNNSINFKL